MFKKRGVFVYFLLSIFMVFVLVNCSDKKQSGITSDADIVKLKKNFQESGEIVLGTSAGYPPFEFYLVEGDHNSELVGIDIDIAREIAKALGVKLKIKTFLFHELFEILNEGNVDFVIAGINPSEKRREYVDFSDIYFKAVQNILIRKEDVSKIKGVQDLRGAIVGVQKGTVQADMVEQSIPGANFVKDDSVINLIKLLQNQEIDAIVVEKPVAEAFRARNEDIASLVSDFDAQDQDLGVAVAVKKNNKRLLDFINKVLADLSAGNKILNFIENANIMNTRSLKVQEPLTELSE